MKREILEDRVNDKLMELVKGKKYEDLTELFDLIVKEKDKHIYNPGFFKNKQITNVLEQKSSSL